MRIQNVRSIAFLLLSLAITGCASITSLPQSASEVDFSNSEEGKTGWSEYRGSLVVGPLDEERAYEAAKAGLRSAGFAVRRANRERLAVLGEHGMTAYDWNVVAGVYILLDDSRTVFRTIVEGSKDIGFAGDATGADWVGRILGGVQAAVDESSPPASSSAVARTRHGTCFVVHPAGVILTNEHVIGDSSAVFVTIQDGREFAARFGARSRNTDLAVLQIEASDLAYLSLGAPNSAEVGMSVFTVGYPVTAILGNEIKYTDGAISSLSGIGGEAAFMQISVPLQPGNSGGPLVRNDGQVVGIVTSTAAIRGFLAAAGTLPQNVNWAVKADYAGLLFDPPPALPATATKREAIRRATDAACRVRAEP